MSGEALRCICVNNGEELFDHMERWESLRRRCGGPIYASPLFSKLWLEAFETAASARVLLVENSGDLVGVAPLILMRRRIAGVPLRTLMLIGNSRGKLGFSPVAILAEPGRPDAVSAMVSGISGMEWNVLRTMYMEDIGSVAHYIADMSSACGRCEPAPSNAVIRSIPEQGDIAESLSRNTRKSMYRAMRALEREGAELRPITVAGAEAAVDTYARQHIERWSARGGSLFQDHRNTRFLRSIVETSLSEGFGYAYELVVDGEVAAQDFGFLDGNRAWGYRVGMNNAFEDRSPGLVTAYRCLTALRERGIRTISLGAGNEGHKQHFGGTEVPLAGLWSLRGVPSWLYGAISSGPGRRLDEALGVRRRLFKADR